MYSYTNTQVESKNNAGWSPMEIICSGKVRSMPLKFPNLLPSKELFYTHLLKYLFVSFVNI